MAKIVPFLSGAPIFQKTASAIVLTLSSIALGCIGALGPDFSSWSRAFAVVGLVFPLGVCALLGLVKPAFFGEPRYFINLSSFFDAPCRCRDQLGSPTPAHSMRRDASRTLASGAPPYPL